MSVKKDASGRRSVEAEVEVPGTPEEVWAAIATGPGVSSWFVPTTIEEREGGEISANFGPGMESNSTIESWEPPHRFVAEKADGMGPGSPAMATEWSVEARSGGKCLVRVVHRWFADTDDWDKQFEGVEKGWPAFFRILRLCLTHFRAAPSASFQIMAFTPGATANVWAALGRNLALSGLAAGRDVRTSGDAPQLAGIVEHVAEGKEPEFLLRLEAPAPGYAHLVAMSMGGQVYLSLHCCLFGDRAAATVTRDEPVWQAWMAKHFPSAIDVTT